MEISGQEPVSPLRKFLLYFSLFMSGFYLVIGFIILFSEFGKSLFTPIIRYSFGLLLVGYGVFRSYVAFNRIRSS